MSEAHEMKKVARIFAATVEALAEIESMKAANWMRESQGHTIMYGEEAFQEVPARFGISSNQVIQTLYHEV